MGEYSAGTILEVTPDGRLKNKYTVPSVASPNMTFSEDGKTMYVMAVDNKNGAPYREKSTPYPFIRRIRCAGVDAPRHRR